MDDSRIVERWTTPTSPAVAAERITAFLRKVYGWMGLGLAVTALVAFQVASSPALLRQLVGTPLLFFGLILAELGLVVFLSARADRLAVGTATLLFLGYAALNGVTLSVVLLAYTGQSVTNTFVVAAGMFGAMALYGSATTRSLAGIWHFLFMGLIGLLLASLAGFFWNNNTLQFVIAAVGVLVFTGLSAWDAQRLKQMALVTPEGHTSAVAIVGALALYLDFLNLFLSLLRLFGTRRE
jgi:FtsH-binding integral membrane protein